MTIIELLCKIEGKIEGIRSKFGAKAVVWSIDWLLELSPQSISGIAIRGSTIDTRSYHAHERIFSIAPRSNSMRIKIDRSVSNLLGIKLIKFMSYTCKKLMLTCLTQPLRKLNWTWMCFLLTFEAFGHDDNSWNKFGISWQKEFISVHLRTLSLTPYTLPLVRFKFQENYVI